MKTVSRFAAVSGALALAALAAGCASSFSRLDGERYYRTNLDTYPVTVTHVDGKSTALRSPVLVEAGRHEVTVQAMPTPAQRVGESRTITLDVAPCTRYWLVAVKPGPLSTDFSVRVDYTEAIAGCAPPRA